jgi:hypothetical protein
VLVAALNSFRRAGTYLWRGCGGGRSQNIKVIKDMVRNNIGKRFVKMKMIGTEMLWLNIKINYSKVKVDA